MAGFAIRNLALQGSLWALIKSGMGCVWGGGELGGGVVRVGVHSLLKTVVECIFVVPWGRLAKTMLLRILGPWGCGHQSMGAVGLCCWGLCFRSSRFWFGSVVFGV